MSSNPSGVAVYCGSSLGSDQIYAQSAMSVGRALAASKRTLVYGGGSNGLMGVVSGAALVSGGQVAGVRPFAMVGGEISKAPSVAQPEEVLQALAAARERSGVEDIIVNSMHDRKVEMAKRSGGFIGLPGGFGTFEEVFEVTTWTQLGIHDKPVVLLNVLSFYEPLRQQIKTAIDGGFIHPSSTRLITFVDGPADPSEPFDWGKAALAAIDSWATGQIKPLFDWTKQLPGTEPNTLAST